MRLFRIFTAGNKTPISNTAKSAAGIAAVVAAIVGSQKVPEPVSSRNLGLTAIAEAVIEAAAGLGIKTVGAGMRLLFVGAVGWGILRGTNWIFSTVGGWLMKRFMKMPTAVEPPIAAAA